MSELCVGIRGIDSLKHELDRTRENLRDTDATIEKLTGRPAFANRPFARRGVPPRPVGGETTSRGQGRTGSLFHLAGYNDAAPPPAKRVAGTFGRLGLPISGHRPGRRARDEEEEDELPHKLSLQSSVIAAPKETKSRQEAIAQQQSGAGGDSGTARNRRMFGLLLGTLEKFQRDERTKEQQTEKRKAVELKLEEKQREERDRLKRERFQLFSNRRQQQVKLRVLEQKMELVEIHSAWEAETLSLENFIRTTAKPPLFFLPKSHIPESQAKLDDSKRVLRELIAERRKQLEEELEEIMKENKDIGDEVAEEYGGSDNDAGVSEMVDPDNDEYEKNKSQKQTANEESDLDESDMVGVEYEHSFVDESAHNVSTSESKQGDASEQTAEKTFSEKEANDETDLQSQTLPHVDVSKKDLSDTSVHEDKTEAQHDDDKRRRPKHRDDDKKHERRSRHSSSHRHSEKHGSRERRRRDKDRKHSHSQRHRDKDDDGDNNDRHREQRRHSKDDDDDNKHREQRRRTKDSDDDDTSDKHREQQHRSKDGDDDNKHREHRRRTKDSDNDDSDRHREQRRHTKDDDDDNKHREHRRPTKDSDNDDSDRHREQRRHSKDGRKKKQKKVHEDSDSGDESGDKSKHVEGDDQKSP